MFVKNKAKVAGRVGFSERREFLGGRFRQLAMSPIFVDIVEVQINAPRIFGGHSHFVLISITCRCSVSQCTYQNTIRSVHKNFTLLDGI